MNLKIEAINMDDDGAGSILIKRSKTDKSGEGAIAYLSPLTMKLVKAWIIEADIGVGPLFYSIGASYTLRGPLKPGAVSETFKQT